VLTKAKADAALIASMVHYGTYTISEIKTFLAANAVKIRKTY
jgi:cyclase